MSPVYPFLNAIEWASAPWMEAMLRTTLEGALVLALLWLLLRVLRQIPPSVQCWLWRAAYGKMLISLFCAATITLHALPASLAADQAGPDVSRAGSLQGDHRLPINASRPRLHDAGILDAQATDPVVNAPTDPTSAKITCGQIVSACFVVWCIGVLICLALMVRACRRARRLRRNALPLLDPPAIDSLARLCRSSAIGHAPELLLSCEIDSPLLVGICRPAVLVPAELMAQVSHDEFRAILAHEVEHLRRHDLLWNWLTAATNALFFVHPFVWLARRELALTSEAACDTAAVSGTGTSVGAYLAMVLKIASGRRELPHLEFAGASIVESYKTLQRRFLIMKSSTVQSARRRAIWGIVAIILATVGILPWRIAPRAAASTEGDRPATSSATSAPSTKPVDEVRWRIKSVKDLKGNWTGAKDGVSVELKVDDTRPGSFPATLTVAFTSSTAPQLPGETPVIQVSKSTDLRCKLEKHGGVNLYLPAYLGNDKAIKRSSWNGKKPVAEIRQTGEETIELQIIPTGYENPNAHDYDFPAVDHLILRGVAP